MRFTVEDVFESGRVPADVREAVATWAARCDIGGVQEIELIGDSRIHLLIGWPRFDAQRKLQLDADGKRILDWEEIMVFDPLPAELIGYLQRDDG